LIAVGTCAALALLAYGIVDSMGSALPFLRQLGADLPAPTLFLIAAYQWWWLFPALALVTTAIVLASAGQRGAVARFASGCLIGVVFLANVSVFGSLLSLFLPFFRMCGPMELSTGFTRLHAAAALGREESVRRQMAKGAIVDVRDDTGATPLLGAVSGGHLVIVAMLLERSADANAATAYGQTPLHAAAVIGRADIAERLLTGGARVDAKNRYSGQPLHLAAYRGHLAMATLLLDRGADVNAEDDQGATPLDQAVSGKQNLVADLIVQRGGVRSTKESRLRAAGRAKTQATAQAPFGSCGV
jgi:ankyrin repeat protein